MSADEHTEYGDVRHATSGNDGHRERPDTQQGEPVPKETAATETETLETLRRNLDRLHEELASGRALDPETREMLETVANDIERTLRGEHDADSVRERLDRLEGAALRFEAEHPSFARVLTEVTDALTKIGV
jgi:hypothetical protein